MNEILSREILQKSRYPSEWERLFEFWSQPPSQSEQVRCEKTVHEIKEAIRTNSRISSKDVITFAQGSYANRVNVRQDSDVDVCVLLGTTIFVDYPPGISDKDVCLGPSEYSFSEFKDDVECALVQRFGRNSITRGNKAFDVHSKGSLVDADVPAACAYRLYFFSGNELRYHQGTALVSEKERVRHTNFPEQQQMNGRQKNDDTKRRYRQQVRIAKTLRNNMEQWGEQSATGVSSFGLECMFWNVPDAIFLKSNSHHERFTELCSWCDHRLRSIAGPQMLREVNGIKQMFGTGGASLSAYAAFFERVLLIVGARP